MSDETSSRPATANEPRFSFAFRVSSLVLWSGAAILGSLLLLRFGLRALGVRPDVAVAGLVYLLIDWLVTPFYRLFPLPTPYGARFDTPVIEIASLGAAGVVFAVALGIFAVGLLVEYKMRGRRSRPKP